jgi:hypothetical protein
MKKYLCGTLLILTAFVGCPLGTSSSGGDNAMISELNDYCPQRCLKMQECNGDLLNLKWDSLEKCEEDCGLVAAADRCAADCDAQFASDEAGKTTCVNYCRREVDVDACKAQCTGISDEYYHTACISGCDRMFSQACADVHAAMHDCYLNLACDRAVIFVDFGGSASALGECTDDDGESTNC